MLLLQFLEIQQKGLHVESHVPSSRSFQFYSHHSNLSSACRKIRCEPAWLLGDSLLSAPVVCLLTGVRATGIAAVQGVVRCNEHEAEQHRLLLFMSSWGIHALTHAFSLPHTHTQTHTAYPTWSNLWIYEKLVLAFASQEGGWRLELDVQGRHLSLHILKHIYIVCIFTIHITFKWVNFYKFMHTD